MCLLARGDLIMMVGYRIKPFWSESREMSMDFTETGVDGVQTCYHIRL